MAVSEPLPVTEARAGDPAAWDTLFRRFQLPLYVYAMEMIRNEQTALDVVQETFIAAVRHIAKLRDDRKFGSWLFGIAHQKCIQHWRSLAAGPVFELIDVDFATGVSPAEALLREEDEELLYRSIQTLSEEHRAVVLLHYLEEFSVEEIGQVLRIPTGTVKSRLFQAKARLRDFFKSTSKTRPRP